MTQKDKEDFAINNICRFCEKRKVSDKVRGHCHLTSKNHGPANSICNINVTQQQSNNIPFILHNPSNYDCHMFFKRLVDLKSNKVEYNFPEIFLNPMKNTFQQVIVEIDSLTVIDSYQVV